MKQFKIFVVEDDDWYRELISYTLRLNPDFDVSLFQNGTDMLSSIHEKPDLITLDYSLPDMRGDEILDKIKSVDPSIDVLVISEQENIQVALDMLKKGAYDYIVKSKDIKDQLLHTINHVLQKKNLKEKVDILQKEVQKKYEYSSSIIGSSKELKQVFSLIETATKSDITVTVTGETGTGKELVSKAIHYNSGRKEGPFVAVNMAAIPKDLAESELFGHEKGAFTGANFRRIGKFEEANGGTLFLDEIGEIDASLQAKLLRVLQEKEFSRVGSNDVIKTDCRIVVATNKDLLVEVKENKFRDDLYYRLFGLTIKMPALRNRNQDIIIIAKHFIQSFCEEQGITPLDLSPDAQKKLLTYAFPGNVRELRSIMELAVAMSNGASIDSEHINFGNNAQLYEPSADGGTLREHNHRIIDLYLKKHNNNIKAAAEELDISYSTIYRVLKEQGIDTKNFSN